MAHPDDKYEQDKWNTHITDYLHVKGSRLQNRKANPLTPFEQMIRNKLDVQEVKKHRCHTLILEFLHKNAHWPLDTLITHCLTTYVDFAVTREIISDCICEYIDSTNPL